MNNTQPILKWAGGKRKLAPLISDIVKYELGNTTNYVEPFFGGGAVFFEYSRLKMNGYSSIPFIYIH